MGVIMLSKRGVVWRHLKGVFLWIVMNDSCSYSYSYSYSNVSFKEKIGGKLNARKATYEVGHIHVEAL